MGASAGEALAQACRKDTNMSKATAKLSHEDMEGHGEDSQKPQVKKGTFMSPATFAPLQPTGKGYSPNVKSGTASGVEY
jgi:hypothetical protein